MIEATEISRLAKAYAKAVDEHATIESWYAMCARGIAFGANELSASVDVNWHVGHALSGYYEMRQGVNKIAALMLPQMVESVLLESAGDVRRAHDALLAAMSAPKSFK